MRYLTTDDVGAAALGGAYLGGGGGGSLVQGRRLGELAVAMGRPRLITLDELDPTHVVVTVSSVGAPASAETYVEPADYVRAVELLVQATGARPAALITNENGGSATVNGWLQSACLGLPVLDAPCNGRAHPTGVMGAMGLHHVQGYVSTQVAVGGDADRGRRVELTARGALAPAAALVRQAAVQAGGLVAVARNPVSARYVREHAAPGAVSQAIAVGRHALAARPDTRASEVAAFLGGSVAARGAVSSFELRTEGGFDVGVVRLRGSRPGSEVDQDLFELTFWNEYMTLERTTSAPDCDAGRSEGGGGGAGGGGGSGGSGDSRGLSGAGGGAARLATFPDLIMTLDTAGMPLTSAEVRVGMEVLVLVVPARRLVLGAGMRDPDLFRAVEAATGKSVIPEVFGRAGA